jgi:hypothetical protein
MVTRDNKDREKTKEKVQRDRYYNCYRHWIGIDNSFRTHSLASHLYD